jgi:hypothetical protein
VYVQVITGSTRDAEALRARFALWEEELLPGAAGFMGSTAGIADDGTFVVFARFNDHTTARANSRRPEQDEWWSGTAALLEGEATFRESGDVTLLFGGGSDDAGFVQVMEGRVFDRTKADAFETGEMLDRLRAARPDLLGAIRIWLGKEEFVEAAYFTSEADARSGEASAAFAAPLAEYLALFAEMTYVDLRDPIMISD